jgi:DNA-directed RNA polymerase subunit RPC12/RpoP
MGKEKEIKCVECGNLFKSIEHKPKFCCRSCSSSYNNKRRNLSKETKEQISSSLAKYHESKSILHIYVCAECKEKFSSKKRLREDRVLHCDKCKRKVEQFKDLTGVSSILQLSKRTVCKVLKRMKLGCSKCGWNEAACDIHHIGGKKIADCDNHINLSYLCPNCHRLAHSKILKKEQLVSLKDYIGDAWKTFYNV